MLDPGITELFLILVIGLLVLGPERLPTVATKIGRFVGKARRTVNQLRHQLERAAALEESRRDQKKTERPDEAPPVETRGDSVTTNGSASERSYGTSDQKEAARGKEIAGTTGAPTEPTDSAAQERISRV